MNNFFQKLSLFRKIAEVEEEQQKMYYKEKSGKEGSLVKVKYCQQYFAVNLRKKNVPPLIQLEFFWSTCLKSHFAPPLKYFFAVQAYHSDKNTQ